MFFSKTLPLVMLLWVFFRQHLNRPDVAYILAAVRWW